MLAGGLVAAMSPWFATAAVAADLRTRWALSVAEVSWLVIVVQLGFVVGAVASALTRLADRVAPHRLVLVGAAGAAGSTVLVVLADNYTVALFARGAAGAFLAGVYPPALKAMAGWYRTGRGTALGVMIGALTVGSALPHLVNALGGFPWQGTLLVVAALTMVGGLAIERFASEGPHAVATAAFDAGQLRAIVGDREFRLASLGYFGHMWELYAMWAWIGAFYADVVEPDRGASLLAFLTIAAGAAGSVHAGRLSDRVGRSESAAVALRWSASVAVVVGFLVDAPWPLVTGVALVWGYWVVADSAQFSTVVTEVVDPRLVGTALTIQLATGFVLTVFTIFLVPIIRDAHGWGWAFLMLAPGPLLGVLAMRSLRRGPRRQPTPEPVPVAVSPFF